MSNLNLSGNLYPISGNQYYKSISARGTKSAFAPGSIDCCKTSQSSQSSGPERTLTVDLDLSKWEIPIPFLNQITSQDPFGAGPKGYLIALSSVPHLDPHSRITGVTFNGNNSITDSEFAVELGVKYGPLLYFDPAVLGPDPEPPSLINTEPPTLRYREYVPLNQFGTFVAGPQQKPLPLSPLIPDNMNVGQVSLSPACTGVPVLPKNYTGRKPGTLVLKILKQQRPLLQKGKLKVSVTYVSP